MSINRKSAVIPCLTALLLLLTACASEGTKTSTNPAPTEAGKASSASAPVELSIASYSGWTEEAFEETFGKSIRAKFPQYTFKFIPRGKETQYYENLLATGQPVDIIWDSLAYFVTYEMAVNMQSDMTDLVKKHNVNIAALDSTMVDAVRAISDGKLAALPVVYNTQLLYYNKDIFDKFGVPYPKNGMTWDQVIELNKLLTRSDDGVQYAGLSLSTQMFWQNPFSIPYVDKATSKSTLSNGKWDDIYDVFARLGEAQGYREVVKTANKLPSSDMFYKERNVAMLADLANTHLIRDGFGGFNWDVVSYPSFSKLPGIAPQASPTIFGVANISKHKDEAMEVIKYLVSEPFQTEVARKGTLPAMKNSAIMEAYGQESKFKDKNVKVIFSYKNATIVPPTIYNDTAQKAYVADLKSLVLGEIDRNTLIRKAEEAANKGIELLRK
jgi:multiple sugar transport system substrate-binding protein